MAVTSGTLNTPTVSWTAVISTGDSGTITQSCTGYSQLTWTATQSGNVSTISWTVKYKGTGQRAKFFESYITLTAVTGTLSKTGQQTVAAWQDNRYYSFDETIATGSFTLTHNSSGVGKFKMKLSSSLYDRTVYKHSDDTQYELPTLISKCTAPTSVTLRATNSSGSTSGIITPSGKVYVAWLGASGGSNNTINGYDVYLRITSAGSNPTTSSYHKTVSVASTSTATNTTISISDISNIISYRGYKIKAGVVTKGTAGADFYSSIAVASTSITLNNLPTAPTINKTSPMTIASGASAVTVTATPGSDANTSQTTSIKGGTSSSVSSATSTATQVTLDPGAGSSSSYYFWTYDGLELSSASTSITVTRNAQPELTDIIVGTTTYTVNGAAGASGSRVGWCYAATPTVKYTKAGSVTVTLEWDYSSATSSKSSYSNSIVFDPITVSANTNKNLGTFNIHGALAENNIALSSSTPIVWRLKIREQESGGLSEYSDYSYWPSSTSYYAIAPRPSSITVYDQILSGSTAVTSNKGNGTIWKDITAVFPKDTSLSTNINDYTITGQAGNVTLSVTKSKIFSSGNNTYLCFSIPDGVTGGSSLTFNVTAKTSDGLNTKNFTITATETPTPTLSSFAWGLATLYPYNSPQACQVSLTWPFGTATTIDSGLSSYNCKTIADGGISLTLASDTSGNNSKTLDDDVTWSKSSDTIATTISNSTFIFNFASGELGISDYTGTKYYYAQFKITNKLGKTYSIWSSRKSISFNKTVENITLGDIYWSTSSTGTFSAFNSDSDRLVETMWLRVPVTYKSWMQDNNISVKLYQGSTQVATATASVASATSSSPLSITTNVLYKVGEITNNTDYTFTARVENKAGTTSDSNSKSRHVLKMDRPYITINSCSYTTDSLTYDFGFNKTPINTSISSSYYNERAYIWADGITNRITKNLIEDADGNYSSFTGTVTTSDNFTGTNEYYQFKVKYLVTGYSSTASPKFSYEKTITSDAYVAYTERPTVAYRPNQIGINIAHPEEYTDSVLIIQPSSASKKLVKLVGTDQTITINLQEGRIY